jgi:hypothetical protein
MTEPAQTPTDALLTAIRSTDWTQLDAMRAILEHASGPAADELRALISKIEAVKEIMQLKQLSLFDVPLSRPARLGDIFRPHDDAAPLFGDAPPAPVDLKPSASLAKQRAPQRIPTEAGRPNWDEIDRTKHSAI